MNKNIIILGAIGLIFVIALSMSIVKWQEPYLAPSPAVKGNTATEINKNITELSNLDNDFILSAQDDIVSAELDETLVEAGEINMAAINLINDEKNLSNIDSDLGTLSGDEAADKEIDQALQEALL